MLSYFVIIEVVVIKVFKIVILELIVIEIDLRNYILAYL